MSFILHYIDNYNQLTTPPTTTLPSTLQVEQLLPSNRNGNSAKFYANFSSSNLCVENVTSNPLTFLTLLLVYHINDQVSYAHELPITSGEFEYLCAYAHLCTYLGV